MHTASDVMTTPAPTVSPDMTVKELSKHLLEHHLDGVCVVSDGELLGVVTSMDLIYKEKKVHLPTFFFFLDAVIPTSSPAKTYEEVMKMAGSTVGDILTHDPITVAPTTPLDEVASKMVDKHLTILPVMDDGALVGLVTKNRVMLAAFGS